VSWVAIVVLAAGAYACKALGLLAIGDRRLPSGFERVLALVPAALLAALIAVDTFGAGRSLVVDARAAGVAAGALVAWRRAPFPVVVVVAAAVTAGLRALGA
jgi:branched-subunit amino acid transport protein